MDYYWGRKHPRQRQSKKKPPPPAPQIAHVTELATSTPSQTTNLTEEEQKTLSRIEKCLTLGYNASTPQHEAQHALYMAGRLMRLHNVTQAQVLSRSEPSETQAQLAGQSTVTITNTNLLKRVIHQTWINNVTAAMRCLFDCKNYTSHEGYSLEIVFYGLAANTKAAAKGFEMAHNLIQEWTRYKPGIKYDYSMGCSDGFNTAAQKQKDAETAAAIAREKRDLEIRVAEEDRSRAAKIRRLGPWIDVSGGRSSGSDKDRAIKIEDNDSDSDDDIFYDSVEGAENKSQIKKETSKYNDDTKDQDWQFDTLHTKSTFSETDAKEIELLLKPPTRSHREPTPPSKPPSSSTPSAPAAERSIWATCSALVTFRQNASKLADDYLKSKGIKLYSSRKRTTNIRNWDAYNDGVKDGKTIDVRVKRIRSGHDD